MALVVDRNALSAAAPEARALLTHGTRFGSTGRLRRGLLVIVGTLCIGLGAVGVVVPILPTTPFLLLAAACFLRSSERLNGWLLGNRVFGEYLRRYRDGEGLPLATKITVIALLWLTLGSSILIMFSAWWLRALLLAVGVGVTIHITRIKTDRRDGLTGERSPL